MRIAMLLLGLDRTDGVLEHRGDVEADVDRLAVRLSPHDDIEAALAVGGLAEHLAHQRAAAVRLLQPMALGLHHGRAFARHRHHRLFAARAVAAGKFRLFGGGRAGAGEQEREAADHAAILGARWVERPTPVLLVFVALTFGARRWLKRLESAAA